MALSEAEELELLRLKAGAGGASKAPSPVPEYEGNMATAAAEGLGTGFVSSLMKLGENLAGDQASNPRLLDAAGADTVTETINTLPQSIKAERQRLKEGLEPARQAFPKTTGVSNFVGEVAPYVMASPSTYAPMSASLLTRAAAGAVEGGLTGAIAAEEGERGEGALWGTALGGGIPFVTKALTGMAKAGAYGVNQITDAAATLMDDIKANMFVPLSQALPENSLLRMWYRGVVANDPAASGVVRGQYDEAVNSLRTLAMTDAMPDAAVPMSAKAQKKFAELTTRDQFDVMHDIWDKAYNFMHDLPINAKMLPQSADDWINKNMSNDIVEKWNAGRIDGKDFTLILTKMNKAIGSMDDDIKASDGQALIKWMDEAVDGLDDQMGPKYKEIVDQWQALKPKWKEYMKLRAAEARSTGVKKEFNVKQMSSAAKQTGKSSDTEFAKHAELAENALENFESRPGVFQMLASMGISSPVGAAVGGAVAGVPGLAVGSVVGPASAMAINRMLASPKVQKALVGRTQVQQAIQKVLETQVIPHAQKAQMVRQILTQAGIVETVQE